MATPVKDILKGKKYPKWFASHPIFKEVKAIKKVFPAIGLPNFEEEIALDNNETVIASAKLLIADIRYYIDCASKDVSRIVAGKKATKPVKDAAQPIVHLLTEVSNQLKKKADVIVVANNRISLKLPNDISVDNKPIFRKNESLFRVYNKLNDMLFAIKHRGMSVLDQAYSFKKFSAENIPANKMKIVFSSDGANGAWDIATMSSRGIRSCQSWDGGEYKHCTIGSVIDPFVGIMYLTSGATDTSGYGSKMMRRCIVRFVIDGKNNKPYILLDHMYPEFDKHVLAQFVAAINKRTDGKFDVHYSTDAKGDLLKHSYLPLNDVRKTLKNTGVNGKKLHSGEDHDYYDTIQSYQDLKIKDKTGKKLDKQSEWFEKNSAKKTRKFREAFAKAFVEAVKSANVKAFPVAIQSTAKNVVKEKYAGTYYYALHNMAVDIANLIVEDIDRNQFTNSDTYIRRVFYNFFNKKRTIIEKNKARSVKSLNGGLHLKKGHRFGVRSFVSMMNIILPEVDKKMKEELKKVVEKRSTMKIEPLPLPV